MLEQGLGDALDCGAMLAHQAPGPLPKARQAKGGEPAPAELRPVIICTSDQIAVGLVAARRRGEELALGLAPRQDGDHVLAAPVEVSVKRAVPQEALTRVDRDSLMVMPSARAITACPAS
jgi:hypothetical protein